MKISLFVSLCCGVVFYSSVIQAACVQPPSCEELGFTADASKCEGSFLKCPWDLSKAACKEKEKIEVGAILYGDGTVSKDIISDKTPIGVVFDVENRLAMALTDVKKDGTPGSETMTWSSEKCNTPGLQKCGTSEIPSGYDLTPITCGTDGRLNTDAILASTCNGTTYAANATNSYQPAGCMKDFCKETKWFLPSLRDLQNIYIAKDQLDTTLTSLSSSGATTITPLYHWSSTEYASSYAWEFHMNNGDRFFYVKRSVYGSVRPVVAY